MPSAQPLAIRFVSGRLEGGVVPLQPGCSLLVGRQPGADVLLTEDLVSRRHARIAFERGDLVIEDLGSTNGTFVNGCRVDRMRLGEGDRVLVGESVFVVVPHDPAPSASATEVRTLLERAVVTAERRPVSAIQGRLDEVPLHDLLQLLASAHKSGVLVMRNDGHTAEIGLDRGHVNRCSLDGRADISPRKAMFRLFGWSAGQFELRPPPESDPEPAPALLDSTDALLLEGARQLDEMRRLRATLPPRLRASAAATAALDDEERALVELVERHRLLDAVLDATPLPDLVAAEKLATLHAWGVVEEDRGPA